MSSKMDFGDVPYLSHLRIVLMGGRVAGKSSTGNNILGREEFDSKASAQCVRRHGRVADRHITVIEAPGWWWNYTVDKSPERLKQEILLSVSLCPPGPHAILLMIRVNSRFKEAERKAVEDHLDLLGERVWSHTIVVFTRGDSLLDTSIEQHIESEGQDLQRLLDRCGNRYHVLNNRKRSDGTQIKVLLEKIEETVAENNGRHYEIDRKILQEMEERKRAQEQRAEERMKMMQQRRENIRSQMMRGVWKLDTWSVGSSAFGYLGLGSGLGSGSGASSRSDSPFSFVYGSNLQKRCDSMELPSPNMSGDERSDPVMNSLRHLSPTCHQRSPAHIMDSINHTTFPINPSPSH